MAHNPVVLSFHESLLRLSDVELLNGPNWLNDTLISFYFEYLEIRKFKNHPSLLFVPPQVTQCIKITPSSEMDLFLKPLNSKTKDFIFFALNDNEQTEVSGGTHWSLLVYSFPERKVFHFDSSTGSNQYQAFVLGERLLEYLDIPYGKTVEAKCLQQNNGYDCGIHVLAQCEQLAAYALKYKHIEGCPVLERDLVQMKRKDILSLISTLRRSSKQLDEGLPHTNEFMH